MEIDKIKSRIYKKSTLLFHDVIFVFDKSFQIGCGVVQSFAEQRIVAVRAGQLCNHRQELSQIRENVESKQHVVVVVFRKAIKHGVERFSHQHTGRRKGCQYLSKWVD